MVLKVNGRDVDHGANSPYVVFTGERLDSLVNSVDRIASFADFYVNGTGEGIEARYGRQDNPGEWNGEVRIRPFNGSTLDLSLDQSRIEILEEPGKGNVRFLYSDIVYAISDGLEDSYGPVVKVARNDSRKSSGSNADSGYEEIRIKPQWPRIETSSQEEVSLDGIESRICDYAMFFKALKLPERLRIIHELSVNGEMDVRQIQAYARQGSQPTTSANLAILGSVGLVRRRKDGKRKLYSLDRDRVDELLFNFLSEPDVAQLFGIQIDRE